MCAQKSVAIYIYACNTYSHVHAATQCKYTETYTYTYAYTYTSTSSPLLEEAYTCTQTDGVSTSHPAGSAQGLAPAEPRDSAGAGRLLRLWAGAGNLGGLVGGGGGGGGGGNASSLVLLGPPQPGFMWTG